MKLINIVPNSDRWLNLKDLPYEELNIPVPHLVRVCKGRRKSTRGFKWCYFDDSEVMNNG